ncbi:hypothetical protein ACQCX2_09480 [Propionibacteriaceae bacterium Y1700]|uniref:hypothetical protein n=1 Tax=Microlunatus sp. Y1700 TaxID=3418487 RepID=UPI003DA7046E
MSLHMIVRTAIGGLAAGAVGAALLGVPSWSSEHYGPGLSLVAALYGAPIGLAVALCGLLAYAVVSRVMKSRWLSLMISAALCSLALFGLLTRIGWVPQSPILWAFVLATALVAVPLGFWATRTAVPHRQ